MAILTLGVNHTTAPVSIRERLAFPAEQLQSALRDLIDLPQVGEAAILSTCNRTEVYCELDGRDQRPIVDWMCDQRQFDDQDISQYLYSHFDAGTIRHMFRVACGLDSMILGEPQILGQMKTAYQAAREAGTVGKILTKLFHRTFAAAKKVRTDTAIGCSPVSVAFAAIRLAQRIFDDLGDLTAILVGAGETIELTARHLTENRIGHLIIANRTFDRAHTLANQFGGFAISLEELPKHLAKADIIVASTGSPLPILGKGSFESALRSRRHKPMFIVDLAVPRDIEPEVEQLQDVYLYTVDDLQHTVEENLKTRQEAALQAEEIIDLEVEHFLSWLRAQAATETIRDVRRQAELHRDAALQRALRELRRGKSAEDTLRWLADTLTNKIIHAPSSQIWQAGVNERADIVAAARELFQLKDPDT
ncbi:glutamyl-tRNA reductase [Methylococcus capsulatus str. Bath]|jgi:glutamyl-tRNA reductase|uniref:Glutamyl-tRNA reductase n=1 Tax=Methylococcus capsulatus (strain ATCC 33009 / NCIMB 11132 / Bath) TaxID=243233 RepID=HEM1_METCA|nr:glutamyl-tRNA reductase [Methylococcus capsulatus]Q60A20.1 RecName: Full=Glutamyl-tRNA reductase; Short=GluTR [Methylococcus capsulatus str. Bath]AAU92841.1 glutamyl-tRNA reductase [Methylococcus capsulatus str. Bath]